MPIKISSQAFANSIPSNPNAKDWIPYAEEYFELYGIDTNNRIAGFMSQTGHESGDFKTIVENLNYSWERLREVFGSRYFPTDAIAKQYHRQPEKIANHVYNDANRSNKIGNVKVGDGWLFRGSGLIQLTGRSNVSQFAASIGKSPEETAEYCRTQRGAFHSACWFWKTRGINKFCDASDIVGMSRAVNGGDIGLADRKARWERNRKLNFIIGETSYIPLTMGSRGDVVKAVQIGLGFVGKDADGIYGRNTTAKAKEWQKRNGYEPTGSLTSNQVKQIIEG